MLASEARDLTLKSTQGPVDVLLEYAYMRIREAANKGKSSVAHPFFGCGLKVTRQTQEAALARLRIDGYTVTHHEPLAGSFDPREVAYDNVSW